MVLLRIIVAKVQWSEFHEKTKGEIRHETNRHEFKMRELLASSSASPVRQSRRVTDGTPAAYLRIRRLLSGSGQSCRNSSIRLRALSSFRNSLDAFRMLSSIVAIAALVSCALAQPVNGVSATVVETRLIRFEARNTLDANFNFTLASQPSFRSQRLPLFRNVLSEEMNCVPQRINLQGIQATRDNNLKLVITLVGGQVTEYPVPLGPNGTDVSSFEWNPASSLFAGNFFALHMVGSGRLYGNEPKPNPGLASTFYQAVGACGSNDRTRNWSFNSMTPPMFSPANVNTTFCGTQPGVSFSVTGGEPPYAVVIQYPGLTRQYDVPFESVPNVANTLCLYQGDAYIINIRDANGTSSIAQVGGGGAPAKSSASSATRATAGIFSVALAGAVVLVL